MKREPNDSNTNHKHTRSNEAEEKENESNFEEKKFIPSEIV